MSESTNTQDGLSTGTIGQVIGIFALTGVGIGTTGGVVINQLGTGSVIASGIIFLVVLSITFLIGPIIGLISGLRVGDKQGRNYESYLASLFGSVAGYFIMILAVLISLAALMPTGGGGEATAVQSTTGGSFSGDLQIGEYIVPIILVALPTGITSLGGVYFTNNNSIIQDSEIKIPEKYKISKNYIPVVASVIIIVVVIVAAGATIVPGLLSPQPQLEVDGTTDFSNNAINADVTVTNPSGNDVSTTLTVELVIDGSVERTDSEQITVPANDESTLFLQLVEGPELTPSQVDAVNNGNMELRFKINDQVVDTDIPG